MQFYFAPMEGITGYVYRGAHHRFFPDIDKYFTPFITTHEKIRMKSKELRDILPENNEGVKLVPQLLSADAAQFLETVKVMEQMGYREINLNLGCPSKTVVTKGKGAGFLADPDKLDRFLDEVYGKLPIRLSIKTRIGMDETEEAPRLFAIYNQYPLSELIIHPRLQAEYYKLTPHLDVFADILSETKHSICYNGDLFGVEDYRKFTEQFPMISKVMMGRGLLSCPWLATDCRSIEATASNRAMLEPFIEEIYHRYWELLHDDRNVLFKMKELWIYLSAQFPHSEKYQKRLKKATKCQDYEQIVTELFENYNQCEMRQHACYSRNEEL